MGGLSRPCAISVQAHYKVGCAVMALLGFQAITAGLKPRVSSPLRWAWNFHHHYLGRVTLLMAWVNCFIGVNNFNSDHGVDMRPWVRGLVALDVGLRFTVSCCDRCCLLTYQPVADCLHTPSCAWRTKNYAKGWGLSEFD
jgi:hypothetical protein